MRQIKKGAEPERLIEYRNRGKQRLDSDAPRQDIRKAQCHEQRGLCAFCQSRIRPDSQHMKVAHVVPQGRPEGAKLGTTWTNLVGSCTGGEGKPAKEHHCDKSQGSQLLPERLHPVYLQPGTVTFNAKAELVCVNSDPEVDTAIRQTLNLNTRALRDLRENKAKELAYVLQDTTQDAIDRINDEIQRLEDPNDGNLEVCVDYQLFLLRLRKAALQPCASTS